MYRHRCIGTRCTHDVRYRLMQGISWEGISVREVFYNKNKRIEGWSKQPVLILAGTRKEVIESIVDLMGDLDKMLEATKEPVLDESKLLGVGR